MEDKPPQGSSARTYTWWDIQDENAKLPVKETTQSDLQKLLSPKPIENESGAFQPKNALKTLGKAMNQVVAGHDGGHSNDFSPPVSVIAFKLLDLVKAHDDFARKGGGRCEPAPTAPRAPRPARAVPSQRVHSQVHSAPAASAAGPPPRQQMASRNYTAPQAQQQARAPQPPPPARPPVPTAEPSLMSFDSPAVARKTFNHSASMPPSFDRQSAPKLNETRAEKLKREYSNKSKTANRVWDDVDQRWVEVDARSGVTRGTTSAPPASVHAAAPQRKAVGIKLDASNAAGKSAAVQAAVHQRVNDMRESQAKALQEVREREHRKKMADAEEDSVRRRLEPKIKAWSEEHGKKKQLRALLGSLHTVLWPEADWKPVNIGDILDDAKCKRCFHKASRVVHPDKAQHLDAEKRFLAKRIFDALSQAKSELDG